MARDMARQKIAETATERTYEHRDRAGRVTGWSVEHLEPLPEPPEERVLAALVEAGAITSRQAADARAAL